jgi:translation elongation factor EF-Tu-like GTPase
MRAESDGGRHCPFTEGYAPHFVVAGSSEWLGVRAIQCPSAIAPGDTAEAVFGFLYPTTVDYSALQPGSEFAVHEGPRVIATGSVL